MDYSQLKTGVEKIEMPEEMQERIIQKCRSASMQKMEGINMNTPMFSNRKKIAVIEIAAAFCLCMAVAVSAAVQGGYFRDITNWTGAVTGEAYEQATEEIEVRATVEQETLCLTATILVPDSAPYRELEALLLGRYKIVDAAGNVLAEGKGDDAFTITESEVVIPLSLEGLASGSYKLAVSSFVGTKKADQPLEISGNWECSFTVQ